MSRRRTKDKDPRGGRINSDNPVDLERRIFVGNLPTANMTEAEFEEMFSKYGKIAATCMLQGYGFVQYLEEEDADAAVKAENGRIYKGYRLDINKAAERRKMKKNRTRSSPPRRGAFGLEGSPEPRRDRSPLRISPRRGSREPHDSRRDSREIRDSRDLQNSRERDVRGHDKDFRDARDAKDPRDAREFRDPRDSRDLRDRDLRGRDARDDRDLLFERYKDIGDPLSRVDASLDKYRLDDSLRKKEDVYDPYRNALDRFPDDRAKREERRREELYRQYFEEIQRRMDADRPVDCSVVVLNKQSKDYAESVGRKVRDLGMMVDLIFLNTEVSLSQALEDVTRGGSPFAIVITQQHQTHRSCTVNILFGTPQEHRNMPLADAMMLIARSYERYKTETREKEREDIARQAVKLSADAIIRERSLPEESGRGSHPPGVMTLFRLLADNRFITSEEIDKVILYLQQRKERMLSLSGDPLSSQLSRQTGTGSTSIDSQSTLAQPTLSSSQSLQHGLSSSQPLQHGLSSTQSLQHGLSSTQSLQHGQPLTPTSSTTQAALTQQELQAKILSLFNSGSSTTTTTTPNPGISTATAAAPNQSFGGMSNPQQRAGAQLDTRVLGQVPQRSQPAVGQLPNAMGQVAGVRAAMPRPGPTPQMQYMYGQLPNRLQAPSMASNQRPGASSSINFDNPSVQKALDTLIQSGSALSHLVNQTSGPTVRM